MATGPIYAFGDEQSLRAVGQATRLVLGRRSEMPPPPSGPKGDPGEGCDPQNAIWDIALFGTPTSGTVDLTITVNAVTEVKTFPYDCSAAAFKTELATHAQIDMADVTVTGSFPYSTVRVEFGGALANQDILQPTADRTNLYGGAGLGIICQLAQKGHA